MVDNILAVIIVMIYAIQLYNMINDIYRYGLYNYIIFILTIIGMHYLILDKNIVLYQNILMICGIDTVLYILFKLIMQICNKERRKNETDQ